jgi:hypothetical protein
MEDAFAMLRGYSRSSRVPLSDVARAVIDRSISSETLRSSPPLGRAATAPKTP